VKVCPFQKHPSFSLPCDEEEETFLKKHYGHLLQEIWNFCSTYTEPQTEISDLIRDLKLLKIKQNCYCQDSTVESSERHCESNSISLLPKDTQFFIT
jgi:hypothetical protein